MVISGELKYIWLGYIIQSLGEMNKRKGIVAPRSGMQFKVGPPFERTILVLPLYASSSNMLVSPIITARIDRGFDMENETWIGYKRNYFTVVAAFEFEAHDPEYVSRESFYTVEKRDQRIDIDHFAIRISALCCDSKVDVSLVQHTAKRDRGPQSAPPLLVTVPGALPDHEIIKKSSNIRNQGKIELVAKLFLKHLSEYKKIIQDSILQRYPTVTPHKVARYERVQFTSTMKYQKPPIIANRERRYRLQIELVGVYGLHNVVLANTKTVPIIIRGRSPSTYPKAAKVLEVFPWRPFMGISLNTLESEPDFCFDTARLKKAPQYRQPLIEEPSSSGKTDTIEESEIFDSKHNLNLFVDSESYNDENSSIVRPSSFCLFQDGNEISLSFDVDLFNCNQMFPLKTEYLLDKFQEADISPKKAAKKRNIENTNSDQIDESVSSFQRALEKIGKELLK